MSNYVREMEMYPEGLNPLCRATVTLLVKKRYLNCSNKVTSTVNLSP